MKAILKQTVLWLCLACMLLSLVACGKEKDPSVGTEVPTEEESRQPEEAGSYEELAPSRNWNGDEFKILCTLQTEQFFKDVSSIDTLRSEVFKRNLAVETMYNIKIEYVSIDGNGANEAGFATEIRKAALAGGDGGYDLVIPQSYYGVAMGLEGLYYNFNNSEYLNLDESWYYQSINEQCEIHDQTYFLASAFLMDKLSAAETVYYNVDIGESFGIDENVLYQQVIDGKWTIEALEGYAARVGDDPELKGIVSSSHGVRGMLIGCDTPYVSKQEDGTLLMSYYTPHLTDVFDKVYAFFNNNSFVEAKDLDANLGDFPNGKAMFALTYIHTMMENNNLDKAVDYMILPMPKYDEAQQTYITDVQRWELVSVPYQADTERACIVLDALSYYTDHDMIPVYWNTLLGTRFSRDDRAGEIVNLIRDSIYFDFTAIFQVETKKIYSGSPGFPNLPTLIMNKQNELTSWWQENGANYQGLLDALVIKYEELQNR